MQEKHRRYMLGKQEQEGRTCSGVLTRVGGRRGSHHEWLQSQTTDCVSLHSSPGIDAAHGAVPRPGRWPQAGVPRSSLRALEELLPHKAAIHVADRYPGRLA